MAEVQREYRDYGGTYDNPLKSCDVQYQDHSTALVAVAANRREVASASLSEGPSGVGYSH